MKWQINFRNLADKFIAKNHIEKSEILPLIVNAVKKVQGDTNINLDIRKKIGDWHQYF